MYAIAPVVMRQLAGHALLLTVTMVQVQCGHVGAVRPTAGMHTNMDGKMKVWVLALSRCLAVTMSRWELMACHLSSKALLWFHINHSSAELHLSNDRLPRQDSSVAQMQQRCTSSALQDACIVGDLRNCAPGVLV